MSQTSASNELVVNKALLSEGQLNAGAFDLVGGRNACRSFFHALPSFSSLFLLPFIPPLFISSAVF